jgi:hypothetical protein
MLLNVDTRERMDNFYSIFPDVAQYTSRLVSTFLKDKDIDFSQDPSIDIRDLAIKVGITEIIDVPPEEIPGLHAVLKGSVIKLNKNEGPEDKNFSIAHEIFHFISRKGSGVYMPIIARQREIWIKNLLASYEIPHASFEIPSVSDYYDAMPMVARGIAKSISPSVALYVYFKSENLKRQNNDIDVAVLSRIVQDAIIHAIEEEIADYFAANLLVPTGRFMLWEGRSNEEIASVFKVNSGCIQKRRQEMKHEISSIVLHTQYFDPFGKESVDVGSKNFTGIGKAVFKVADGLKDLTLHFMVDRTASGNFEATLLEFGLISWSEEEVGAIEGLLKQTRLHLQTVMKSGGLDSLKDDTDNHVMDDYWRHYRIISLSSSNEAENLSIKDIPNRVMEEAAESGDVRSITLSSLSYTPRRPAA